MKNSIQSHTSLALLLSGISTRTLNDDLGGGPRRAGRVPGLADVAAAVALVDGGEPQEAAGCVDADRQPRLALLRPGQKLQCDHSGR